jgi:hypothetical protein
MDKLIDDDMVDDGPLEPEDVDQIAEGQHVVTITIKDRMLAGVDELKESFAGLTLSNETIAAVDRLSAMVEELP